MLEKIILFMLILSIITAVMNNNTIVLSNSMISGAKSAIELILSIIGLMALWSGIMRIAEKSGIINTISKLLKPVFNLLFKETKKDKETANLITINVTANMFGLGNAATPAGIKAVNRLNELRSNYKNSNSMLYFILINTASVQLIPITIATIRAAKGASQPFDILISVWFTSFLTLLCGLLFLFLLLKLKSRGKK